MRMSTASVTVMARQKGTKGSRNAHPNPREPGKPLACPFAARWKQKGDFQSGSAASSRGWRPVAMDICWWEGTGSPRPGNVWGEGWSGGWMPAGGVGSGGDVSSSREAKGVLGLDEAFPRAGHPRHGGADGVTPTARGLGWISCVPRAQRVISEPYLWHFSVYVCVQNSAGLCFEASGSALQLGGRCRAGTGNKMGVAGVCACSACVQCHAGGCGVGAFFSRKQRTRSNNFIFETLAADFNSVFG